MVSPAGADRRIPTWASRVVSGLARDRPVVVTKEDLTQRLTEAGCGRDPDSAIRELRRIGWLVQLPVKGTWAFIPPGEAAISDPYLPLRSWLARDQNAGFMLAGASAAWHLGYLDRQPDGRIPIWLPPAKRLPDGLASYVSVVRIPWNAADTALLAPRPALLVRRRLDLVAWATGLPALGPEALLVQIATRPASFGPWADLVPHLDDLVADCSDERLERLLSGRPTSAWQRASYLLDSGGEPARGQALLAKRHTEVMPV
ncbi:hypothetical protein N092_00711, partial [Mycobacterium tuberculosis variant africanum MAL020136]